MKIWNDYRDSSQGLKLYADFTQASAGFQHTVDILIDQTGRLENSFMGARFFNTPSEANFWNCPIRGNKLFLSIPKSMVFYDGYLRLYWTTADHANDPENGVTEWSEPLPIRVLVNQNAGYVQITSGDEVVKAMVNQANSESNPIHPIQQYKNIDEFPFFGNIYKLYRDLS